MVKMAKNRKKRVVLYLNSTKGVAFSWSFFSKVARSSFRGGKVQQWLEKNLQQAPP